MGELYLQLIIKGWNTMSNNWVNNDEHVYAVYYFDNGASHWHVTNNLASNGTVARAFFMAGGTGIPSNVSSNFWVSTYTSICIVTLLTLSEMLS